MKIKSPNRFLAVLRRVLTAQAVSISFLGCASAANSNLYWDGGTASIGSNGDGASLGTAGTWNNTLTNWDAGAVPHVAWVNANNDLAIFGGTAGIVTLGSTITANALTFNTTGYSVTASTLTLGGPSPALSSSTGSSSIASTLAGTGGFTKTGAGTVIINPATGNNTITGAVTVSQGELQAVVPTTAATYTPFGTGGRYVYARANYAF